MMTTQVGRFERRDLVSALNRCIEASLDGQRRYAAAAADVVDPSLKRTLFDVSRERSEFVIALQSKVRALGAVPENEGTLLGVLQRGWMAARRVVEGNDDKMILGECLEGDRAVIAAYDAALRDVAGSQIAPTIRRHRHAVASTAQALIVLLSPARSAADSRPSVGAERAA